MITNADLTIYHAGADASTRSETWTREQVRNVTWEDRKAANVLRSGNLGADRVAVYIPLARGVSVAVGDVLVRGLVADEIGAGFSLADLRRKYPDSATVRSVDRLDRGNERIQHLQIGGS